MYRARMEPDDPEALRRRLYRPGASAADLTGYLRATAEDPAAIDPDEAGAAPAAGSPLRPFVIGGLVVVAAAVLGAALLSARPTSPAPAVAAPTATTSQDADAAWRDASGGSVVLDGGERDHARGSSVAEGPEAVRYTVASGDTVGAIADRFQLCQGDVLRALPYGFDPARPAPGETLRLVRDAATAC